MNAMQAVALYTARELQIFLDDEDDFGRSEPRAKARSATAVVAQRAKVHEHQVREAARLLMGELYRLAEIVACARCGCTDEEGCFDGCFWVKHPRVDANGKIVGENLCSSCAPRERKARR